jgi:hypothetical protein
MTTIVTAFYPIKSKFPPQQYMEWAQRFLQLAAPIVLFTEPELVDTFKAMRLENKQSLHIVATPFHELDMWVQYKDEWRKQHALDHEAAYHTPELYAIWAQKPAFVAEAIRQNPFQTEYFYWCDIGAFRDPNIAPEILETFPTPSILRMISANSAILLNSVAPLEPLEKLRQPDGIMGDFRRVNRIVGGLWGGTATACMRWYSAYETQLIRYFQAGRFAGKDQSVMLSAYLENTQLAVVARPTTKAGDHWFFQHYLLTDNAPFEQDRSYSVIGPPPPPPVTVKLMGGLGNQLFQIATAWAYAKQHGGRLMLAPTKEVEDGRPMYWSSIFQRFRHFLADATTVVKPVHWEPAATEYAAIPAPSSLGMRLQGYFQSPLYFLHNHQQYAAELKALIRPTATDLIAVKKRHGELFATQEMQDRIVVIHARRTDYLKAADHHGPLTAEYYRKAMDTMAQKVQNPFYVLVADDPLWFLEVLPELPQLQTNPFTILTEDDEVVAFTLLQQFRHYIIANSTYSWWFAWLADAQNVIAPKQWFGPTGPKRWDDIYMPHWIRV